MSTLRVPGIPLVPALLSSVVLIAGSLGETGTT
jgi:hypothetical protein